MKPHSDAITQYLDRIYNESRREHACCVQDPAGFARWRAAAHPAYLDLLKLDRIARDADGHQPVVELAPESEDMGAYTRRSAQFETEPGVQTFFWLLRPKGDGPFPVAITPHGHGHGDGYVGVAHTERGRQQIETEDEAVAVQAVRRGFLTIAPATRGIGANPRSARIADIAGRHGGRDCVCHSWQVLLAGRVMLGERVWDLMRIVDWASALDETDASTVLMVGSSGGGMATLHAAAADERVTIAVPCCAYNNYVSRAGTLRHCPCNAIPGILEFGEFWDVAGLIAPRHLLTVNGETDDLHPVDEVDAAAARLKAIYTAAGHPDRYEHRYGPGGHRFFADRMWPWIEAAMPDM